jgi:hypothetical protein
MSYPRRVLANMTVLITRRALRRTMLLRPDPELNNLVMYCLAVQSVRFGIVVHHFTVMSDHYHLIVTDSAGQLPNFLREFDRTLALGVKVLRGWEGALWDHAKPSIVELRSEQAVIEKIAYCMANPTAALAVRRAHQWPGLTVLPEQLGRMSCTAARPEFYFDPENPRWPATATLRLEMPRLSVSDSLVREEVARELAHLETEAHTAAEATGGRFIGAQRVRAKSPYCRATSRERRRDRNPSFAIGRDQREAFFEAVRVLREFRRAYRQAMQAWRARVRDAVFPLGTWAMVHLHGASVAIA